MTLTGSQIEVYRILTLRQGFKLEMRGLKRKGKSCYNLLKEAGFKGSKQEVMDQVDKFYERFLEEVK
jgi:hypothetical protein